MRYLFRLLFASSSPTPNLFYPAACLALVCIVGCGAGSQFDLGIPASKSESFFFHMKSAALSYGYGASVDNKERTLRVETRSGKLLYNVNDHGGLQVTLASNVHQNNKEMEQRWLRDLEKSHDKILERARGLSKANQDWD